MQIWPKSIGLTTKIIAVKLIIILLIKNMMIIMNIVTFYMIDNTFNNVIKKMTFSKPFYVVINISFMLLQIKWNECGEK
jgi:hypothetical protein